MCLIFSHVMSLVTTAVMVILLTSLTSTTESNVLPVGGRRVVKRQLTLTDYIHVWNPNPGANGFDWLPGNSEIQSPGIPVIPSPPSTPFLG